jgi:hypothetical protein
VERAVYTLEITFDRRDHHMFRGELYERVRRIELPAPQGLSFSIVVCCYVKTSILIANTRSYLEFVSSSRSGSVMQRLAGYVRFLAGRDLMSGNSFLCGGES